MTSCPILECLEEIHASPDPSRELLGRALKALEQEQPEWESRRQRLRELLGGAVRGEAESLEHLLVETEGLLTACPERAEEELTQVAAWLPELCWQTPLWHRFCAGLEAGLEGDWEGFERELQEIDGEVELAWDEYAQLHIREDEVTLETVLGHRFLLEGLEGWKAAVEEAFRAAEEGDSVDRALEFAEQANRMLVAVGVHAERVAQQRQPSPLRQAA